MKFQKNETLHTIFGGCGEISDLPHLFHCGHSVHPLLLVHLVLCAVVEPASLDHCSVHPAGAAGMPFYVLNPLGIIVFSFPKTHREKVDFI